MDLKSMVAVVERDNVVDRVCTNSKDIDDLATVEGAADPRRLARSAAGVAVSHGADRPAVSVAGNIGRPHPAVAGPPGRPGRPPHQAADRIRRPDGLTAGLLVPRMNRQQAATNPAATSTPDQLRTRGRSRWPAPRRAAMGCTDTPGRPHSPGSTYTNLSALVQARIDQIIGG